MKTLDLKGLERVIANVREEIAAVKPTKAAKLMRFARGIISYTSETNVVYRNTGEMRLPLNVPRGSDSHERVFDFSGNKDCVDVGDINLTNDVEAGKVIVNTTANTITVVDCLATSNILRVRLKGALADFPFVYFDERGVLRFALTAPGETILQPPSLLGNVSRLNYLSPGLTVQTVMGIECKNLTGQYVDINLFFKRLFGDAKIQIQKLRNRKSYTQEMHDGTYNRIYRRSAYFRNYHADFGGGSDIGNVVAQGYRNPEGVWRVRRIGCKKKKSPWIILRIYHNGKIRIMDSEK